MAIIKAVNSGASLKRAIDYISRDKSLPYDCMDGINCNAYTAFLEMCTTKDMYHSNKGTQYVHLVISLSPEESKYMDPNRFLDECKKLINGNSVFDGFETVLAVHKDKDHLHCHAISNSVSFETGKKTRWYRSHLRTLKQDLEKQVNEYNQEIQQHNEQHPEQAKGFLRIPQKGEGKAAKGSTDLLKILEKQAVGKDYKSWMVNMAARISEAKEQATSQDNFIELLAKADINVKWDNRKTILFTDKEGNKARNSKIDDAFKIGISKEELEHEFKANAELAMMEDFLKEVQNGTGNENAGNAATVETDNRTETARDLAALLGKIDADIESSELSRTSAEAQRAVRDKEQERLAAERRAAEERRIAEAEQRTKTAAAERARREQEAARIAAAKARSKNKGHGWGE